MSAFIVSKGTMNRYLTAWALIQPERPDREQVTDLGRELYDMNLRAVRYRYPDKKFKKPRYTFSHYGAHLSTIEVLIQGYKAGQCLRYNCSEEEGFEDLDTWIKLLAQEIVELTDNYKSAPWD